MELSVNQSIEHRLEIKLELKLMLALELHLEKTHKFVYEKNNGGSIRLYRMFKPEWAENEEVYAAIRSEDKIIPSIIEYYENQKRRPRKDLVVEVYQREPFRRVKRFQIGKAE
jgi:hypothetical protein